MFRIVVSLFIFFARIEDIIIHFWDFLTFLKKVLICFNISTICLVQTVCKNIFCFNFEFIKVLLFLLPYSLWIVQAQTKLFFKASFLKLKWGNWGESNSFVQRTQNHLPLRFQINEFNLKVKIMSFIDSPKNIWPQSW